MVAETRFFHAQITAAAKVIPGPGADHATFLLYADWLAERGDQATVMCRAALNAEPSSLLILSAAIAGVGLNVNRYFKQFTVVAEWMGGRLAASAALVQQFVACITKAARKPRKGK